jgi:hypothetical protein
MGNNCFERWFLLVCRRTLVEGAAEQSRYFRKWHALDGSAAGP